MIGVCLLILGAGERPRWKEAVTVLPVAALNGASLLTGQESRESMHECVGHVSREFLTIDGNPGSTHQLRLVVYLDIYRVLYIPGGARFLPSTVWVHEITTSWGLPKIGNS